jgi:hypothetical protein
MQQLRGACHGHAGMYMASQLPDAHTTSAHTGNTKQNLLAKEAGVSCLHAAAA